MLSFVRLGKLSPYSWKMVRTLKLILHSDFYAATRK